MSADLIFAEPLAQLMSDPLDEAPRIDKDQGRPMGLHLGDNFLVDFVPHLMRSDGAVFWAGNPTRHSIPPLVPDVDDSTIRPGIGRKVQTANKEPRPLVDGFLRGAKTDTLQPPLGECLESFKRKRQVG